MKIILAVLTVSVLLTGAAALKCYKCSLADSDANCNSRGPTQCDHPDADTCTTLSAMSGRERTISKFCSLKANCQRSSWTAASTTCMAGLENVSGCVQCCQGDGCNAVTSYRSDATTTAVSAMATVAMATLACIL